MSLKSSYIKKDQGGTRRQISESGGGTLGTHLSLMVKEAKAYMRNLFCCEMKLENQGLEISMLSHTLAKLAL